MDINLDILARLFSIDTISYPNVIKVNVDLSFGLKVNNFLLLVKMVNIWHYGSMEAVRSVFSCLKMKSYVTFQMPHQAKLCFIYSFKNFKKFAKSCVYY